MPIRSTKISSGDHVVPRPARYWLVAMIALATAQSAHAPFVRDQHTDLSALGATASGTTDKPKALAGAPAVNDSGEYKPLAFADKNKPENQKEETRSEWVRDTPLVSESALADPTDPLAPEPSAAAQVGAAAPSTGLTGSGYVGPLPAEPPLFAADNSFTSATDDPVDTIGHSVASPVTPVPEPVSALPFLCGFLLPRPRPPRTYNHSDPIFDRRS